MRKAKEVFKLGQLVVIIVHNSHYEEVGVICAFSDYNPYHMKVKFDDGSIHGYMANEVRGLSKLGQPLMFDETQLKKLIRRIKSYFV